MKKKVAATTMATCLVLQNIPISNAYSSLTKSINTKETKSINTKETGLANIPDPYLRIVLNEALGTDRDPVQDITIAELKEVTSLELNDKKIKNLTGLENCTNLTTLYLDNNAIKDISPLKNLTNLTTLSLNNNVIRDVSSLSSLTNLTTLSLNNNVINDVSSLSWLTNLTTLSLNNNAINDVSSLSGLTKINKIEVMNQKIDRNAIYETNLSIDSSKHLKGINGELVPIVANESLNVRNEYSPDHNYPNHRAITAAYYKKFNQAKNYVIGDEYKNNNKVVYNNNDRLVTFIDLKIHTNRSYDFNYKKDNLKFSGSVNLYICDKKDIANIPDANLKVALNKAIGESLGINRDPIQDITINELNNLKGDLILEEVENLTGLEHCTNITTLNLDGFERYEGDSSKILDISPLKNLTNLTKLDLAGQHILGSIIKTETNTAKVENMVKSIDGQLIKPEDSDNNEYSYADGIITFNNITKSCNKEYYFTQYIKIGNITSEFSGTVNHKIDYTGTGGNNGSVDNNGSDNNNGSVDNNESVKPSIFDYIDNNVVEVGKGDGQVNNPIILTVKDVDKTKLNDFLNSLKDLNPKVISIAKGITDTEYKIEVDNKKVPLKEKTSVILKVANKQTDLAKVLNKFSKGTNKEIKIPILVSFIDVTDHWAKTNIENFASMGLINGYENGTFKPNDFITRAEFIKIINSAFGYTQAGTFTFTDVKEGEWFYNEVAIAVKAGYIDGRSSTTFAPNDKITREEVAKVLTTIMKNKDTDYDKLKNFPDGNKVSDWAKPYVEGAIEAEYLKGDDNGNLNPTKNITRAEVVTVISRIK